jgi:hypothetical protein
MDAVKEASAAKAAVGKRRAGIERLWDEEHGIEKQIGKLQKAVSKATEAHIAGLANAAALGKPAPRSGVPAAKLAVEAAMDHLAALRGARVKIEADLPLVEKDAVAADVEVDRLISLILVPLATQLIERGKEIASMLAPIRNALATLWAEQGPTQYDAAEAYDQGQRSLKQTKEAIAEYLRGLNVVERAQPDPWIEARKRLREDPHAELPDICRSEDQGG